MYALSIPASRKCCSCWGVRNVCPPRNNQHLQAFPPKCEDNAVHSYISHSAALSRAILLPVIVERAKKCLDFTSTLHIIHLSICSLYDGVPRNWEWWFLQIVALSLMVVLGEIPISCTAFSRLSLSFIFLISGLRRAQAKCLVAVSQANSES